MNTNNFAQQFIRSLARDLMAMADNAENPAAIKTVTKKASPLKGRKLGPRKKKDNGMTNSAPAGLKTKATPGKLKSAIGVRNVDTEDDAARFAS